MERDKEYYFQGDYIFLKVERRLFRIPQDCLVKHLEFFEDMFTFPSSRRCGFSDMNPITASAEIREIDFRYFMQILLPLCPWKPIELPIDGWVSVLKVSTLWTCRELRTLSIEKISQTLERERRPIVTTDREEKYSTCSNSTLLPINLIQLGRKYFVDDWVVRGYRSLINTKEELSEKDAKRIGWEEAYRIMALREKRYSAPGRRNSWPRDLTDGEIRDAFKAELGFMATAAAPYNSIPASPATTVCSLECEEGTSG